MKTVCIESPLAGDFTRNIEYAKRCVRYALDQGVAPFASHLLYPQVLDDENPEHREQGIAAGLELGDRCDERWFFKDLGMSGGMERAWLRSLEIGQKTRIIRLEHESEITLAPTEGLK